jgi:hypothetical protein
VYKDRSCSDPLPQEVTKLLNSQRRYQKINLTNNYTANAARKLLLIERFSLSLVELDVDIGFKSVQKLVPQNLCLPRLKKFTATGRTKHLITANLKMPKLTWLSIYDREKGNELDSFLSRVSGTLIHLSLGFPSAHQIRFVVNQMQNLKSLRLNSFGVSLEIKGFTLQPNHSITNLILGLYSVHSQTLLKSFVNLIFYEVYILELNEAEWIIKNMMKLKLLKIGNATSKVEVHKLYKQLKSTKASINRNIKIG